MATSATFQAELNGVLIGRGTNYPIIDFDIEQTTVAHDLNRLLADGEYQGPQFAGPIFVSFTLNVRGTTEANLFSNLATLSAAWPLSNATDDTLEFNLPSYGARTLSGRVTHFDPPRITNDMRVGLTIFGVRCQFKAGTPTWT
jgi:hypothetical protein